MASQKLLTSAIAKVIIKQWPRPILNFNSFATIFNNFKEKGCHYILKLRKVKKKSKNLCLILSEQ